MVTKPSLHPSYKKIAYIRRSKSWPRSGRMRLLTIVAQIPTCCPMKRLVDQQADLELDSEGNWEPVQNITEERFNLVVFASAAHCSSLAATLRTDCRQSRRSLIAPTSRLLKRSTCHVLKGILHFIILNSQC